MQGLQHVLLTRLLWKCYICLFLVLQIFVVYLLCARLCQVVVYRSEPNSHCPILSKLIISCQESSVDYKGVCIFQVLFLSNDINSGIKAWWLGNIQWFLFLKHTVRTFGRGQPPWPSPSCSLPMVLKFFRVAPTISEQLNVHKEQNSIRQPTYSVKCYRGVPQLEKFLCIYSHFARLYKVLWKQNFNTTV